jgi:NAD(P)-dependent dehydrogenase (short-subunit alcohol dehydrogenase family)
MVVVLKSISDQTILITGSTDGIGKIAALKLANKGALVLIHGRNKNKVKKVVDEIKHSSNNKRIDGFTADFSSLNEVRNLAEEVQEKYSKLEVLINNAGAGFSDERYSRDGYELRFAVNYLAPFLLTHLLLPTLKNSAPSRIINVSSIGQSPVDFDDIMLEKKFDSVKAYRQSKLALIMFTFELAEQLKNDNVTVNSLHPGTFLNTNMVRRSNINPLGEPESGADAEVYLATSNNLNGVTGKYFNVGTEARADADAYDGDKRKRLQELGYKLTNLN